MATKKKKADRAKITRIHIIIQIINKPKVATYLEEKRELLPEL